MWLFKLFDASWSHWISVCSGRIVLLACVSSSVSIYAGSVVVSQPFQDVPFTLSASTSPVFNVTELGETDWALWGAQGFSRPFSMIIPSPYEPDYRKAGGTAIGPAQALVIATGEHNSSGFKSPTDQFGNDGNPGFEGSILYEWTDGEAPSQTGSSLATAALFGSSQDGDDSPEKDQIVIEVEATDTPQRLWVFLTSKNSSVDLTAELSDESGMLLLEDLFPQTAGDPQNDDANGYLALDFVADSTNQTLTLTINQGMRYDPQRPGRSHGIAALALSPITSNDPGDFDGDGDVDGADFLYWQRGNVSSPPSASDLADWMAHYDDGSVVAAAAAIPEPATGSLVAPLCFLVGFRRRGARYR